MNIMFIRGETDKAPCLQTWTTPFWNRFPPSHVQELLLYREELPQDKQARHFYLQLQGHRQKYKAAFVDEAVWAVLTDKLQKLLAKDAAERLEDEQARESQERGGSDSEGNLILLQ